MSLSIMVLSITLFVFGACSGIDDLALRINAPIDKKLAVYWINSLQDAYTEFLAFFMELANNTVGLGIRTVSDFRAISANCFEVLRGKKHETIEDVEEAVKQVFATLSKAIRCGIRATIDLQGENQKHLFKKLIMTIEKMGYALQATLCFAPSDYFK